MIALVAHDAGGAEVVSSYARRQGLTVLLVAEGPARAVFARKLPGSPLVSLDEAIGACTSVLTGTSGMADLEVRAIAAARCAKKFTASFLDHWINYDMRFERPGLSAMPDEVWVGDVHAEQIARRTWPSTTVRVVPNPYFADLKDEFAGFPPRPDSGPIDVLYVTEPIRTYALAQGHERHYGYVEDDALRYFLANLNVLGAPVRGIHIRPHPSEEPARYDWARSETTVPVETRRTAALVEDIGRSDVVAGCESMALVVALLAGRRVVSCIPPGGLPCRLPHTQIEHLQALTAQRV